MGDQTSNSPLSAAVLTVSDSSFHGVRADASGPAIAESLRKRGFEIVLMQVLPDEQREIEQAIIAMTEKARLVVTTGGTGIARRDVTPEATRAVCERLVEGIPERIRAAGVKKTRFAALSRAVCGIRGRSLVLNLPGSPEGAVESLESAIDVIPHALELLSGKTEHSGG